MKGIKTIPIDDLRAFTKWNDTFTRIAYNPKTDVFIFQRTNKEGNVTCYEVVKPRLRDGIRCYPSSDDFGIFACELIFDTYSEFCMQSLAGSVIGRKMA